MAGSIGSLSIPHHAPGTVDHHLRIGGGGAYDGVGWYSVVLMQHFLSNATISSSGVVESPPQKQKYSTSIFCATVFYTVSY